MCRYLASSERRGEPPSAVEGFYPSVKPAACQLPFQGSHASGILPPLKKGGEPPSAVEGFYSSVKPTACQLPFQESHVSVSCLL